MSARQEPGDKAAIRAAIDARIQAEKEKLERDPGAQKALADLRDAQSKEKIYPAPQTSVDDAKELLAKLEREPARRDTVREPIQSALQPSNPTALRPITRKLTAADSADEIVEPVRRLPGTGTREDTLVGSRSVKTVASGDDPAPIVVQRTRWGFAIVLALVVSGVTAAVMKLSMSSASGPAGGTTSSGTASASGTSSSPPVPTASSAEAPSSSAWPTSQSSVPTASVTVAVPTSIPPMATSSPAPQPSVKPLPPSTSAIPAPSAHTSGSTGSMSDIFNH